MITVRLDNEQENQLRLLADRLHQDPSEIVRRIVAAHLDAANWPIDDDAAWADASVAMAPELFQPDDWGDAEKGGPNGSR